MCAAPTPAAPSRILVAEDDPLIRALIIRLVTSLQAEPLAVADGAAALAAVQTHGPTLIGAVLDVVMPHTSGIAVAAAIQQQRLPIPIVLMSGAIPAAQLQNLHDLHKITLLPKPFDLLDLRALVQLMIQTPAIQPLTDAPAPPSAPDHPRPWHPDDPSGRME